MSSHIRFTGIMVVLLATIGSPAQIDRFFWTATFDRLLAYDANGAPVVDVPVGNLFSTMPLTRHIDGRVFLYSNQLSPVIRGYTATGPTSPIFVPQFGVTTIACDRAGILWYTEGSFIGPATVTRITSNGLSLGTANLASVILPMDLIGDPQGRMWVGEALPVTPGVLERIAPDALSTLVIPLPVPGTLVDYDVDDLGFVWVITNTPDAVVRLDPNGNLVGSTPLSGVRAFDLDACRRAAVLSTSPAGVATLRLVDQNLVASPNAITLPSSAVWSAVDFDSESGYWVSGATMSGAGRIVRLSANGSVIATIQAPNGQAFQSLGLHGHTGMHVASVLDREGDSDGDGHANRIEHLVRTNALSPASAPRSLVLGGAPMPGATIGIQLSSIADAGNTYVTGASFGTAGIPVDITDDCRHVPLSADPLLDLWLSPANGSATGILGVVSPTGDATTTITLPSLPTLSGFSFFVAMVTIDPVTGRLPTITAPLGVTIL